MWGLFRLYKDIHLKLGKSRNLFDDDHVLEKKRSTMICVFPRLRAVAPLVLHLTSSHFPLARSLVVVTVDGELAE